MPRLASALSRRGFLALAATAAFGRPAFAEGGSERFLASVTPELDALARWAEGAGARLGACLIDVDSGSELAGVAAGVAENPASNQKLVTAGALLRYLGAERTFATGLYGSVANGRVETLVLRGEGDPSLTSAELAAMAATLRERGVSEVGSLLVDQSAFDDHCVPPGFEQQPAVVDGASHVLRDVFGDAGRHTRSAVGVAALPRRGAVEIEVIAAVSS
jgi:D-alanyl-D-alanine carboxypeptidase/D-alanyl-D-alanine-endopeptidase (penicillin-binding protein 4)